ncbi:MAG: phosphatidylserine decarboxylase, partial [Sphingobacteriia bacterium]|nr:phosphatidylserine decarboxylase [Sphingobacteriia bacterium]
MVIHREGYTLILATLILCGVGAWSVHRYLTSPTWLAWVAYLLLGVITVLVIQFFRNPQRNTVLDPERIIAPADGQVVIIEKVREPEYFGDERLQISIFMSPINVHVNRNPVSGVVSYFRYHPGDYLVAWHPKSSTLNERTTVVVRAQNGQEVLFRQIAGALARRIRWYVAEGDTVKQGAIPRNGGFVTRRQGRFRHRLLFGQRGPGVG